MTSNATSPPHTAGRTARLWLAGAAVALALLLWRAAATEPPPDPAAAGHAGTRAAMPAAVPALARDPAPQGATDPPDGTPDRVAVASDARTLHCRLTGLHSDAAWTAPVRVSFEGFDAAADRAREDAQRVEPAADGSFAVGLPPWTASCSRFEARFAAADPLYLELDVREKAPELAQSRLVATEVYELPVQVVGVLVGRIVDPHGAPVPAARVAALPWADGAPGAHPRPATTTANDGSFRLAAPVACEVLLVAIPMYEARISGLRMTMRHGAIADSGRPRDDLLANAVRCATRFGAAADLGTIVLPEAARIAGAVRAGGEPVAGIRVQWDLRDVAWRATLGHLLALGRADGTVHVQYPGSVESGADGTFALAAPAGAPGLLRLETGHGHLLLPPRPASAPADLSFELAPVVVIRVERGGVPVPDAAMWRPPQRMPMLVTDRRGEARYLRAAAVAEEFVLQVPGLPARRFAVPEGASPQQPVVVRLDDVAFVRVLLEVESAHSTVRQIRGSLQPLEGGAAPLLFAQFRNDGSTPFAFEFPAGRHRLQLSAPGRAERRDTFVCDLEQEVAVGPGATSLCVQAQHGGRIGIDARDACGLQLGGEVRLVRGNGSELRPRFGREPGVLPATGASESENLPPGRYRLVLDLGAHGIVRRTVEVRVCEVAQVRVDA